MAGRGREALLESRQGSGGTPEWTGGVGRPIRMVGGWKPSQKGRKCQESLLVAGRGQEGSGEVGRPSWRIRSGLEALPEFQKGLGGSEGPPEGLGGVRNSPRRFGRIGRPSSRARWGWKFLLEALTKIQEGREARERLRVPPGEPKGVGRLGTRRMALPEGREGSGGPFVRP